MFTEDTSVRAVVSQGLDTSSPVSASVANSAFSSGYKFLIRYYTRAPGSAKLLTKAEAQAISNAGLYVNIIYQDANNYYGAFNTQNGIDDATWAYHYAKNTINQPKGTPIYFAVDYDATSAQISGGIQDYFRAVCSTIISLGSSNNYGFQVGVYGSGNVCSQMLVSGISTRWLAGATGWGGSSTYTGWDIKQLASTVTIGGIPFDQNESKLTYGGGWRY